MRRVQWLRVKELATAAEEIPRGRWKTWLEEECGDDDIVRQEVLALLTADETATSFGTISSKLDMTPAAGVVPGRQLGSWRLVCELGSGGMGAVWLAERADSEFHMLAAVKLVKALDSTELVTRFRRERQILADLKHPNICMLHDGGTTDEGLPYLVMEYVDGQTIDRWCDQRQLSPEEVLTLFRDACQAVGYAHRKCVLHRDIKPQNIMVTAEGILKLMDFGIAGQKEDDDSQMTLGFSPMTPEFAPPERLQGGRSTHSADIYALGLVLFRLLTGMRPRLAEGKPVEVLRRFAAETEHADLLNKVADLLAETLAEDPGDRPDSADVLVSEIDRILLEQMEDVTDPGGEKTHTYDAVLWYHPKTRASVEDLARRLEDETGLKLWLDVWHLIPGEDQAEALAGACRQSACLLVTLDNQEHAPWSDYEQRRELVALWTQEKRRVVPLLLHGAARPSQESKLPPFMRRRTWASISESAYHEELNTLARAIRGLPPGRNEIIDTGTCPFRGLEAFREEDRRFFYGREAITQRLNAHMHHNRFLAVMGPSGSGKSSVVQAGLIPLLRERNYRLALFTPASKPLEELAFTLRNLLGEEDRTTPAVKELYGRLQKDPNCLHQIGNGLLALDKAPLCLVIDQFEEIFTLAHDPTEVNLFLENILHAVEQPGDAVSVVLTMRSDFLGKCALWPDLNSHVIDHMVQVEPMSQEDLALAVRAPAEAAGLRFETGLVERILDDVRGSSGELPLLEHAMLELWERRSGSILTAAAYARIGGIEGALARRAELVYQSLDDSGRLILRKMFTLCLIHPGEGAEDTRRRTTREELLSVSEDHARSEVLLQSLIEARLLTAQRDEGRGIDQIDVAHEALIRKWERIRTWMAEDRETARAIARLRHRAQVWDEAGRDEDHLLRGGPLYQMRELADREEAHLGSLELSYVAAGVELADREEREREAYARRLRLRKNQAFALGAAAFALAFMAFWLFFKASNAQERAQEQQKLAQQQSRQSNFNLARMFNEKAGIAREKGLAQETILYAMAGLAHEIPVDKTLENTIGRLFSPNMEQAGSLMWTSPVAPEVNRAAFSPDGELLALGCWDGNIKLMDKNGLYVGVLTSQENAITGLAFSPDGKWLASTAEDSNIIQIWSRENLTDNEPAILLRGHIGLVKDIQFLPDNTLISSSLDETVRFWRIPDGDNFRIWETNTPDLDQLAHSADGTILAVFNEDGKVLFRREERLETDELTFVDALVTCIDFGGGFFFAGLDNGTVHIFDRDTRSLVHEVVAHEDMVESMTYDPLRERLISSGTFGDIIAWDPVTGTGTELVPKSEGEYPPIMTELNLSADSRFLAGSADDDTLQLWEFPMPDADAKEGVHPGNMRLEEAITFSGHSGQVRAVAFHPKGKLAASASNDNTIRLWQMPAGRPAGILSDHGDNVNALAFSPDGRILASASIDTTIILWYLSDNPNATALPNIVLRDHTRQVQHLAFSPDGSILASSSEDNTIKFWKMPSGEFLTSISSYQVGNIAISPSGKTIAATSSNQKIYLWKLPDKWEGLPASTNFPPVDTLADHRRLALSLAYSPDGRYLASGSEDATIKIWPVDESGNANNRKTRPLRTLSDHEGPVTHVTFVDNGKTLVSASQDKTIRFWHLPERMVNRDAPILHIALTGHGGAVNSLSFNGDESMFVSGSLDKTIRLWERPQARLYAALTGHEGTVQEIAFSEDGRVLGSASGDQTVRIWNASDGSLIETIQAHKESVESITFSKDNRLMASASTEGKIVLWKRPWNPSEETIQLATFKSSSKIYSIAFSPDNYWLASGSLDQRVKLWRVPDDTLAPIINDKPDKVMRDHEAVINSVAISPDGRLLASGSYDRSIKLWDMPHGNLQYNLTGHAGSVWMVAFSPDGKMLASCSNDQTIRLWQIPGGETIATLRGHQSLVLAVQFSPDGRTLVSASGDGTVRLWDVATAKPLAVMTAHRDEVTSAAFHPSGNYLASGSEDQSVRLWNLAAHNFFLGEHDAEAYDRVYHKTLKHFGYRMEGFRLEPETWLALEATGGFSLKKDHPLSGGRIARPLGTPLLSWLTEGIQRSSPSDAAPP